MSMLQYNPTGPVATNWYQMYEVSSNEINVYTFRSTSLGRDLESVKCSGISPICIFFPEYGSIMVSVSPN
jgi:hypothetical protein